MKNDYDEYLLKLESNQLNWWQYSRSVPTEYRPDPYTNYWAYLRNKNMEFKRFVKEAEWRMEARRKGLL